MLLQDGEAPRRVTNVRDDKILTSRFWTPSFQQRRCLVPASSYEKPNVALPCIMAVPSAIWASRVLAPIIVCSRSERFIMSLGRA